MRRLVLSALAATLFVPATLTAQAASYSYVGKGAANCFVPPPTPTLVAMGLPKIGSTTFGIQVDVSWVSGVYRSFGLLLTGFSNTSYGGLTLPFDISVLSFIYRGLLRNSIEIIQPVPVDNLGRFVTIPFPIPNDNGLLGFSFYQQVYVQQISWLCMRNTLSRGGHGVIGT